MGQAQQGEGKQAGRAPGGEERGPASLREQSRDMRVDDMTIAPHLLFVDRTCSSVVASSSAARAERMASSEVSVAARLPRTLPTSLLKLAACDCSSLMPAPAASNCMYDRHGGRRHVRRLVRAMGRSEWCLLLSATGSTRSLQLHLSQTRWQATHQGLAWVKTVCKQGSITDIHRLQGVPRRQLRTHNRSLQPPATSPHSSPCPVPVPPAS